MPLQRVREGLVDLCSWRGLYVVGADNLTCTPDKIHKISVIKYHTHSRKGGVAMAQNPDLHLWRAVLVAGLHDAAKGIDAAWLRSRDFVQVCHLAQVEPQAVLRAYSPERFQRLGKVAA